MSELDLDLSFEDTPTEEADAVEEIVDPLTLTQETLEDFPPLPIMVDMVNEEDDISNCHNQKDRASSKTTPCCQYMLNG